MKTKMNHLKRFLIVLLSLVAMLSSSVTAFATEVESDEDDFAGECKVQVLLIDETGEYDGDVIMTFNSGVDEYSITFNRDNSWGSGNTLSKYMNAPATYRISYQTKDGYEVISTFDRSTYSQLPISQEGFKEIYLSIVGNGKSAFEDESNEQADVPTTVSSDTNVGGGTVVDTPPTSQNNETSSSEREITDEEAEAVFKAFMDKVGFIQTDDSWKNFLNLFETNAVIDADSYCVAVGNGTKDDYVALSSFDKFLYTKTYTEITKCIYNGMKETYFGTDTDFATFKSLMLDSPLSLMKSMGGKNYKVVQDAYVELMQWQYNYVKSHGYAFNFVDNRSYLDEKARNTVEVKEDDQYEKDVQEIESALNEEKDEKGIWDDTLGMLASHMVTILILIALVIALLVVIYIRKKRNYDDMSN